VRNHQTTLRRRWLELGACGLFLIAASPGYAQYSPPAGAGDILDFFSPEILAGGARLTSTQSSMGDVFNPAVSAAAQRGVLDLSYVGLADFSGATQGLGSAINLGVTIPTRAGVLTTSVHYVSSDFTAIDLGPLGSLHASFAKDIFPNLYLGVGLQAQIGADGGAFAWGLAADLGILHRVGDVGFLKDLRWGFAMRGLGKGFRPAAGTQSAYPAPFTPALGAAARFVDTDAITLAASLDLAAPTFGDLRADVGVELGIADFLFIRGHVPLSIVEITQGSARTPITFGFTFKFQTQLPEDTQLLGIGERGWARSEVQTHATVTPVRDNFWAAGVGANVSLGVVDREPPQVSIDTETVYYRSPNFDGVQDDLVLPLAIDDQRYVMGYRLVIEDEQGRQVREIRNKDDRPENRGVQNLLDRLFYVDTGIVIPASLRWDGNGDNGSLASDGTYRYYLEAWDDNANVATTAKGSVVVDNTPPAVTTSTPDLIFSPNGDGSKDALPIAQEGSPEDEWRAEILAQDGTVVASFAWAEMAPPTFEWDGRMADGTLAPDGVYSYRVATVDRAGNTTSSSISNIIVDTQATPIAVSLDDAIFSPNGDAEQDTVTYTFDVPVTTGIDRWRFEIGTPAGAQLRSYSGTDDVPGFVVFDGRGDDGSVVAERTYAGLLQLEYASGNRPEASSPLVTVDLTRPAAAARADLQVFSPNGDGLKDVVTVFQETSQEQLWTATIRDVDSIVVRSETWRGAADATFGWDGRGADGVLVPDGQYEYRLSATDRAGNTGVSSPVAVTLDTGETPAFVTTDASHFSPNGDRAADRLAVLPRLQEATGIERYVLAVHALGTADASADLAPPVRSFSGRTAVPERLVWDGLDDSGETVADGDYLVVLDVLYAKGNHPVVRSAPFIVDTVFPTASVSPAYTLFSPDGDGNKDTLPIQQSSSDETLWEASISDASGAITRSMFWKGRLSDAEWDGKDENGNTVADGSYRYQVGARDAAGNATSEFVAEIQVDTRRTPLFAIVNTDGFSPNDDGFRDDLILQIVAPMPEGLASWRVSLVHAQSGPQRTWNGAAAVPTEMPWDGRADDGTRAPDGTYTAEVSLAYTKGNQPMARSSAFRLDVTPPRITLDLAPRPFSPDNDGVDDELQIGLAVEDISPIDAWNVQIVDPAGNPFTEFVGRGTPRATILWNGLSGQGELVQAAEDYPVALAMRDDLGNAVAVADVIPVDVLVIRDGDKLKIRISSITFPGNSADLDAVADIASNEKNRRTIDRLNEIFAKYSRYTIRIEGHANNLSFADAQAAAREETEELVPLSTARAEAVKAALVSLGLEASRISTVGLGGSNPVVEFADTENRWKNRRVEFVLTSR
jgi:outer membrane protein OmpA-like peptidoglycan-associated protein/flagellar hook assembly protein FlgD